MTKVNLIPIMEKLDRIENKIGGINLQFLTIKSVAKLTSLSSSTIRRAVARGELKCSRKKGKILFKESQVRRWLNG